MKALFVSNDPSIFVSGSATRARMREYAAAIGTLHILSRAPKGAKEEVEGNLILHPIHAHKLLTPFTLARRARALIAREGIEIVSAQDPFEQGWAAARAVRGTAAKLHIQVHTDFLTPWFVRSGVFRSMRIHMPFLNRFRVRLAKKVLPQAHGIRAVSKRVADSIVAAYGATVPVPVVIPISVGSIVPQAIPLPPHEFSFAFMCSGRLEPEKRVEDILMALGKIAHSYPSVGLVVVGEGSERKKLEKLTKKLGLSSRVLFMGEQGKDAWGLMKSANVFVQASAYEGYGRTLIEAALARVPIITTDVGIVGEVLKGYEQVLATPPGDTANIAAHMHAMIGDHQARLTLAMNAEKAAKDHIAAFADPATHIAENLSETLKKGADRAY
ncbi:MAG TPA: glycosyltransferase [Candidatus Paceibacterota bacterium]|nr:glycosyltransferase [Candidatus Paceibacterota bacterium]